MYIHFWRFQKHLRERLRHGRGGSIETSTRRKHNFFSEAILLRISGSWNVQVEKQLWCSFNLFLIILIVMSILEEGNGTRVGNATRK